MYLAKLDPRSDSFIFKEISSHCKTRYETFERLSKKFENSEYFLNLKKIWKRGHHKVYQTEYCDLGVCFL